MRRRADQENIAIGAVSIEMWRNEMWRKEIVAGLLLGAGLGSLGLRRI